MKEIIIRSTEEARQVLMEIGVDSYGVETMVPKIGCHAIEISGIPCGVANILKQEMLSIGGDVAVARGTVDCSISETDAVIMGSFKQLARLAEKLVFQPFGLRAMASELTQLLEKLHKRFLKISTPRREILIGKRTLIMGVLNVTPDSFSDGGAYFSKPEALEAALRMEEEGADIIDIGGESSRPGSKPLEAEEELSRIMPVISALSGRLSVPLSVDTTKASVAETAAREGVEIINDISAMTRDANMEHVIAENKLAVVLMHMRGVPETMQEGDLSYGSLRKDIIEFLDERLKKAISAGIEEERVIIDPGIGFGKTGRDNLRLLRYLHEFRSLGRPILVGPSRKRFIGEIVGGTPAERIEGTAASVTASIMNGAHIVRVHDVAFMKKVVQMTDAIVRDDSDE